MTCYHPWEPGAALGLRPGLRLPCGQCVGCRLRRSAEWATRCIHEARTHKFNSWITLTYDDEHLPSKYFTGIIHPRTGKKIYSGTLYKPHMQRFFRKLRKTLSRKGERERSNILYMVESATPEHSDHIGAKTRRLLRLKPRLRYYYGGEYGEKYGRPHYHACLFGVEFNDKKYDSETETGFKLYTSATLAELWPHGGHTIGDLNWETAAYTARYIMKKITGDKQKKHYEKICQETGEIINLTPEYNDMSRANAIGKKYYENYKNDFYKPDESYCIVRGKKTRVPRYYDKLHARAHPEYMDTLKLSRFFKALEHKEDQTTARLLVREKVTLAQTKSLKQKME